MQKFIIPDLLAAELGRFDQGAQLCDAAGRAFGFFVPIADSSQYETVEPELSDEELSRIEQSTEWYSTSDVIRHLENQG